MTRSPRPNASLVCSERWYENNNAALGTPGCGGSTISTPYATFDQLSTISEPPSVTKEFKGMHRRSSGSKDRCEALYKEFEKKLHKLQDEGGMGGRRSPRSFKLEDSRSSTMSTISSPCRGGSTMIDLDTPGGSSNVSTSQEGFSPRKFGHGAATCSRPLTSVNSLSDAWWPGYSIERGTSDGTDSRDNAPGSPGSASISVSHLPSHFSQLQYPPQTHRRHSSRKNEASTEPREKSPSISQKRHEKVDVLSSIPSAGQHQQESKCRRRPVPPSPRADFRKTVERRRTLPCSPSYSPEEFCRLDSLKRRILHAEKKHVTDFSPRYHVRDSDQQICSRIGLHGVAGKVGDEKFLLKTGFSAPKSMGA